MRSKLLLLLVLLPLTVQAQELTCIKGKIKKLLRGKESVENASYCTNNEGTILVSEACYRKNCLSSLPAVDFDITKDMEIGIGSPGFALCRKMKGSPEIITFKHGEKWLSLDRCIFEPASYFVDAGHLYKLNSQKMKK